MLKQGLKMREESETNAGKKETDMQGVGTRNASLAFP
jgi:hypothetical protein